MRNYSSSRSGNEPENAFDEVTPVALKPLSIRAKKEPYHVFINHRGCDVKQTFASIIYQTLDLVGLRAFLDVEALEFGDSIPEEIQEAMRRAELHIAIFSEKYAESPWCLAELSFMVKTGTRIIPVFYKVPPADLRRVAQGKGIYAHAFSQHEQKKRYSSNKLDEWKEALQTVSNLKGFELSSDDNDEGKLLRKIVDDVKRILTKVPLEEFGGTGGGDWDDGIYSGIRQIVVKFGTLIDSIRIEYDQNGQSVWSDRHGGEGGGPVTVKFDYPNEVLVSISGHYGYYRNNGNIKIMVVKSLTFHTNHRKYGPFGSEWGNPFIKKYTFSNIIGFHGRCGRYLDAIGVHLEA